MVMLNDAHSPGLVVKPDIAAKQMDAERAAQQPPVPGDGAKPTPTPPGETQPDETQPGAAKLKRFHGTAVLDTTRVGRDASRIADEVIAHLAGLVGANVTVTIEIEAEIPEGAPDNVVRTVTENSRTLKFTSQGFERE